MKSKFSPFDHCERKQFQKFLQSNDVTHTKCIVFFPAQNRVGNGTHTHTQNEIAYGPTGKRDTIVENLAQFKHVDGCSVSHVNNNLIWCRCLRLLEANVECDFVRMNST